MAVEDFMGKYFVRHTTWFAMPSAARKALHLFQSELETKTLIHPCV